MAEDKESKTEEATPRKRDKMREEGQIPKSQDVGGAVVVIATCAAIGATHDALGRAVVGFTHRMLRLEDVGQTRRVLGSLLYVLWPAFIPMLVASVVAVLAGFLQTRTFSFTHMMPKPERFNPMSALQQMLPGKQGLTEIGKQLVKLSAVGFIGYQVVRDAVPEFTTLATTPTLAAASSVADVTVKLVLRVSVALLIVAALDYYLVRRKFLSDAMMTKQEVRDEHRQEEGNPEIKGRVKAKMREMSQNRTLADVAKATVLVVNPTHYAVALRYLPERDVAPIVLAKGVDEVALAMRSKARHERVPIVEQPPLARALNSAGKLGRPIPVELYRAVAEVIAYVMQLRARDAGLLPVVAETESQAEPAAVDGEGMGEQ